MESFKELLSNLEDKVGFKYHILADCLSDTWQLKEELSVFVEQLAFMRHPVVDMLGCN